jgi:quercetin dioxygenase-like cupin family protein
MAMNPSSAEKDVRPSVIKNLIVYQSGAIVSRTIANEKGGTVTVFAFDQGQALSEHTAPYDAIIIGLDGRADVKVSGKSVQLEEGQMIKLPANQQHALTASTKFMMLLIMIRK